MLGQVVIKEALLPSSFLLPNSQFARILNNLSVHRNNSSTEMHQSIINLMRLKNNQNKILPVFNLVKLLFPANLTGPLKFQTKDPSRRPLKTPKINSIQTKNLSLILPRNKWSSKAKKKPRKESISSENYRRKKSKNQQNWTLTSKKFNVLKS